MDSQVKVRTFDRHTGITLAVILVIYPILYCSGIMGVIIQPILSEGSRLHWWFFWVANLGFHLVPFFLVHKGLQDKGELWLSVGLDWKWFFQKRFWFLGFLIFLSIASVLLPTAYYENELPEISNTIFIAPVSTPERLFVIIAAGVIAITEEILFRGFVITRLEAFLPSAWVAAGLSSLAFVFIHGTPNHWISGVQYFMAGLAFSIPFILLRFKKLEWLITIHFLIDVSLVLAP